LKPFHPTPPTQKRPRFREKSTKTRIETVSLSVFAFASCCFREKSTKTRIETCFLKQNVRDLQSFREKSTKTRIETVASSRRTRKAESVLEKNPPKQGLKLINNKLEVSNENSFREKSTKTRIETSYVIQAVHEYLYSFREKSTKTRIETAYRRRREVFRSRVLEKNPPKQGLKHTSIGGM